MTCDRRNTKSTKTLRLATRSDEFLPSHLSIHLIVHGVDRPINHWIYVCAQFTCRHIPPDWSRILRVIVMVVIFGLSDKLTFLGNNSSERTLGSAYLWARLFAMEIVNNNRHHKQSSRGQSSSDRGEEDRRSARVYWIWMAVLGWAGKIRSICIGWKVWKVYLVMRVFPLPAPYGL